MNVHDGARLSVILDDLYLLFSDFWFISCFSLDLPYLWAQVCDLGPGWASSRLSWTLLASDAVVYDFFRVREWYSALTREPRQQDCRVEVTGRQLLHGGLPSTWTCIVVIILYFILSAESQDHCIMSVSDNFVCTFISSVVFDPEMWDARYQDLYVLLVYFVLRYHDFIYVFLSLTMYLHCVPLFMFSYFFIFRYIYTLRYDSIICLTCHH